MSAEVYIFKLQKVEMAIIAALQTSFEVVGPVLCKDDEMYQFSNRKPGGRVRSVLGLFMVMVLLGACATAPVAPTAALTEAREAIASAEKAGARQHAGAELDEAQQQLLMAERLVRNEQMVEAERFARQAIVAAELASARTETAKAVAINREMRRSVDALFEEMRRTGDQQ